ncbi:MAG: sugar phosphate isomerase/epimerase family protein [Verrucomicrobiota bacterium]
MASRASASGPYADRSAGRVRLSLAAYSFRSFFAFQRGKPSARPKEEQIGMEDFLTYASREGWDGAELTSYFLDPNLSSRNAFALRRQAFLQGIEVSGTAVGNNFTLPPGSERDAQIQYVKGWIERAAAMGAPHVRIFAGKHGADLPKEKAMERVVECLKEVGDFAGERGVFLGVENHDSVGDAETLLGVIRAADHPWIGVNLDTGNFRTEDPYEDMAEAAPYAVNVQLKVELKRLHAEQKEPTDFARVAKILREANYQGYLALEYEANENPYEAVPRFHQQIREAFGQPASFSVK